MLVMSGLGVVSRNNVVVTGYRGGFSRADIDELLDSLDSNYLGWSAAMAPVIMGNPERPELADELASSFCRTDPAIARVFARTTSFAAPER
jgi:sigma-B regulation protein RsbQ